MSIIRNVVDSILVDNIADDTSREMLILAMRTQRFTIPRRMEVAMSNVRDEKEAPEHIKVKVTTKDVRDTIGLALGITEGTKTKAGKLTGDDGIVLFHPGTEQKFRVKVDELKDQ